MPRRPSSLINVFKKPYRWNSGRSRMFSIAGQLRRIVDISSIDGVCPDGGLSDSGKHPMAGIRMCSSTIGCANSFGTPWNGKLNACLGYFQAQKSSAQIFATEPTNCRFSSSLSNSVFTVYFSTFKKVSYYDILRLWQFFAAWLRCFVRYRVQTRLTKSIRVDKNISMWKYMTVDICFA